MERRFFHTHSTDVHTCMQMLVLQSNVLMLHVHTSNIHVQFSKLHLHKAQSPIQQQWCVQTFVSASRLCPGWHIGTCYSRYISLKLKSCTRVLFWFLVDSALCKRPADTKWKRSKQIDTEHGRFSFEVPGRYMNATRHTANDKKRNVFISRRSWWPSNSQVAYATLRQTLRWLQCSFVGKGCRHPRLRFHITSGDW